MKTKQGMAPAITWEECDVGHSVMRSSASLVYTLKRRLPKENGLSCNKVLKNLFSFLAPGFYVLWNPAWSSHSYLCLGFNAVFKASCWKPKQNHWWPYTDTRNMDMIQQMDKNPPSSHSERKNFNNIISLENIPYSYNYACKILPTFERWTI